MVISLYFRKENSLEWCTFFVALFFLFYLGRSNIINYSETCSTYRTKLSVRSTPICNLHENAIQLCEEPKRINRANRIDLNSGYI